MSKLIENLVKALKCLPGVGQKSAQRMTLHLLERDRDGARALARALELAMTHVRQCERCRNLCEEALCSICANPNRQRELMCVVETPMDVLALEQTNSFRGYYFVLSGHLSPIDGIGPEEIGVELFIQRLESGEIKEVILATNPTVEGEATAHYLAELVKKHQLKASRIAHGVPIGGELEYLDNNTLSRALNARLKI